MKPINQEVLFYLAFAAALYEGCVDQERSTVLTQAECGVIARNLYCSTVPAEQQDQENGTHFEELFVYLYGRTVALLREHSFPELTALAGLLARVSEQEGKELSNAFARRLLASGDYATWYHPLLAIPVDMSTQLGAVMGIYTVCMHSPQYTQDTQELEAMGMMAVHSLVEQGLLMLEGSHVTPEESAFPYFAHAFAGLYLVLSDLFEHLPDVAAQVVPMITADETSSEGVLHAITCLRQERVSASDHRAKTVALVLRHLFPQDLLDHLRTLLLEPVSKQMEPPHTGKGEAMPRQQISRQGSKPHALLIERFRQQKRLAASSHPLMQELEEIGGKRAILFGEAFLDAFVDLAKKYRLAPSALAVVAYLPSRPLQDALLVARRFAEPVWIELEEPLQTPRGWLHAFSFGSSSDEHKLQYAQARVPLEKRVLTKAAALLSPAAPVVYECGLDALGEHGEAIWTIVYQQVGEGDARADRWRLPQKPHSCQDPTCGVDGPFCQQCMETMTFYFGLYANMLSLIAGEFSEQEEPEPFQEQYERVTRKDPDPRKTHKLRTREVVHTFSLVTFNAASKRAGKTTRQPGQRGSWVAQAQLDPQTAVVWVTHHFAEPKRRLRHERYRNYILSHGGNPDDPAGFELQVRPFKRRTPIKLETLKRRMMRVIYEHQLGKESHPGELS